MNRMPSRHLPPRRSETRASARLLHEHAPARPRNARARADTPQRTFGELLVAWVRELSDQRGWPRVRGSADGLLFAAVVALIVFGVVMVYSATAVRAVRETGNGHHYLVRQGVYACIGVPLLSLLARVDYHRYRALGKPLLLLAVTMLAMVVCGFGHQVNGSTRWLVLGPVRIQPAEIAKVALIVWLADSLAKKSGRMGSFSVGFLPHVMVAGLLVVLCMKQPDFGSSVVLVLLTFVLMFTAGAKIGYMLAGAAAALPVAYWLVASSPYRLRRFNAFVDPLASRLTDGYQLVQSVGGFWAGGLTGVGLGDSRQKLLYLPEAHTDFIAAIVAEELGFVGFALLVTAFALIVQRGIRAALHAVDDFGVYLAIGLTMFIGIQAVTNLWVVLGLVPTKGMTLPFLSSGGSSLLVNCAAVGILLNVSRPRRIVGGDSSGVVDITRGAGSRRVSGGGAHDPELQWEGGAQ
jgi:cell division protein FtsW